MSGVHGRPGDPIVDPDIALADVHVLAALEKGIAHLEASGYQVGRVVFAVDGVLPDGDPFRAAKATPVSERSGVASLLAWAHGIVRSGPSEAPSDNYY